MNRVITMTDLSRLVGMEGKSNRLITRKLKAVAESRCGSFQLFKLGKTWCTTEEDLRRLIPELFTHDATDEASLRAVVARQSNEIRELTQKVERLENKSWASARAKEKAS